MAEIKDIQMVDVEKLIPYENNSKKHPEKQIAQIQKSIQEFGFLNPILIDKHYQIIAGHGRTEAAKGLHIDSVPCVFVEGLTDEQRKAYIIADNRLTELGGWDKEKLSAELDLLDICDFDIELTGFDESMLDYKPPDREYFGDERERTNNYYNLDIAESQEKTADFWQMPFIKNDDVVPSNLIGFNYAKTSKDKNCGIHFFIDDYQFERVWNHPEKYIDVLKDYECILTPDFSLYMDMPMPMKIWNIYRSRSVGAYYQENGLKVIPTISWAEKDTFEFCFEGIEQGSVVAVSTVGIKQNKEAMQVFKDGMDAMIAKINPRKILVYGGDVDFDYQNIEVVKFDNHVTKRMKSCK